MWENWEHRNTRCGPNPHLVHKLELHAQQNVQTSSGNPKFSPEEVNLQSKKLREEEVEEVEEE